MKRCPQCQFIYEDEQRLCDMDGAVLAHDSSPLVQEGVARETAVVAEKSQWRTFAFAAGSGIVLGVALFMSVYVFAQRSSRTNFSQPSVQASNAPPDAGQPATSNVVPPVSTLTTDSSTSPTGDLTPADKVKPSANLPSSVTPAEIKRRTGNPSRNSSESRKSANATSKPAGTASTSSTAGTNSPNGKKGTATGAKPGEVNEKKDSKVESILKKTGRLLKKPFKF